MRNQKLQVRHNLVFVLSPPVSVCLTVTPPFPQRGSAAVGNCWGFLFPCAIRPSPRSNMLSASSQSPYLALCFFFWRSGNLFYPLPSQKKTRECNHVKFHAPVSSQCSADLWIVYLSGNQLLYLAWLGLAESRGAVLNNKQILQLLIIRPYAE